MATQIQPDGIRLRETKNCLHLANDNEVVGVDLRAAGAVVLEDTERIEDVARRLGIRAPSTLPLASSVELQV